MVMIVIRKTSYGRGKSFFPSKDEMQQIRREELLRGENICGYTLRTVNQKLLIAHLIVILSLVILRSADWKYSKYLVD